MEIITIPDPRLRLKSKRIRFVTDETRETVQKMVKSSLDWEKDHPYEISAAMAAPQLGINERIIIVRDNMDEKDDANFTALINPEVIKTEGKAEKDYEGCLSVPNIYGLVSRPSKVRIKALLEDGHEIRLKAEGSLARVLLHEIDHLDGVLFIDHVEKSDFFKMNDKGDLEPIDAPDFLDEA